MDPEDILQKADRLRSSKKSRTKKKKRNKADKIFTARRYDSWYIYSKIYPYRMNIFIWVFVILTIGLVLTGTYFINYKDTIWVLYIGIAFVFAFLIRLMISLLMKILRYKSFKNWDRTLRFEVNGWDSLGTDENFPKKFNWDKNVEFSVKLSEFEIIEGKKLINSALYLLVHDINKSFYKAGVHQEGAYGDLRKKWDFTSELSVNGSANGTVLGHIYLCINKNLRAIHKKYGIISSADIIFSGNIMEVKRLDVGID